MDYPGAVDLPLGLAVALLTGPDGSIKLDMPVKGNVDDPEFEIGGVVMKTFANLIGKLAASPFNLLGRLVGMDSEKLDRIEFRPGSAELAPPEQEKAAKLVEALLLRPNLALELRGVSDAKADGGEPVNTSRSPCSHAVCQRAKSEYWIGSSGSGDSSPRVNAP